MTDPIISTTNQRIKGLVRLRDRRQRDRSGRFLVEGFREIRRAIDAGIRIEALYVCPPLFLGSNEPDLIRAASATGAVVIDTSEQAFRKASYRDRPEGVLAVCEQFETSLDVLHLGEPPLVLVAESIEKPGNLGTMLRTADATGASVIVCDRATDPFNPNVVRASIGTLFTVPVAVAETSAVLEHLRRHQVETVALAPATSRLIHDVDLRGPIAIVVGSEQYGLTDRWLSGATHTARLPMKGAVDSLNAAIAAAVGLYEALRQRAI